MARDPVRSALKVVLKNVPCSLRQLARKASVPHSTLVLARDGKIRLSPDVTRKVVTGLRDMGAEMAGLADVLEQAAKERGDE